MSHSIQTAHLDKVPSPVRPAMHELLALAAAVRPDWNADALNGAVVQCHQAGWPWVRTLQTVVRLLCDPKALPRELAAEANNPLQRKVPPPVVYRDGVAAVRAAMRDRRHVDDTVDAVAGEGR